MQSPSQLIKRSSFWENFFKAPTQKSDLENVLSSMPPFSRLGSKNIRILMKIVHNRVYSAGEYIFYQGDPGIGLYIIREGEVQISYTNKDEIVEELASFGRSDFFGELAMLDNDYRSASAISISNSNIAVIFKPDLDEYIEKYPRQGNQILKGLAQILAIRLRKLNDEYVELLFNDSNKIGDNKNGDNQ